MGQKEVLDFIKKNNLQTTIPEGYLKQLETNYEMGRLTLIYLIDEKFRAREKANENARKKQIFFKENGRDVLEKKEQIVFYEKLELLRKLACQKN